MRAAILWELNKELDVRNDVRLTDLGPGEVHMKLVSSGASTGAEPAGIFRRQAFKAFSAAARTREDVSLKQPFSSCPWAMSLSFDMTAALQHVWPQRSQWSPAAWHRIKPMPDAW